MTRQSKFVLCSLLMVTAGAAYAAKNRFLGSVPVTSAPYSALSGDAVWPWPGAQTKTIALGVTQTTKITSDGTALDLFDFDFGANPRLRWEIFDQDEDDDTPLDNKVSYWKRNVARATKELDARGRGPVLVAWNGAFFGYNAKDTGEAFHVSPVVLRGKVLFNSAQHRWTFGVKQTPTGPQWKVFFKPNRQKMKREFDYAAGSVQCLVLDGKPLRVEPFPQIGEKFKTQPVPSSAAEAGHIPYFDHMRTCRASVAWSRDNRHLYFLAVKEPDDEAASSLALSFAVRGGQLQPGTTLAGGWTVLDVQKFWQSKGVWGAVNSDAGGVLQWVARQKSGGYEFVPPRQQSGKMRLQCAPSWNGAIEGGGAIMYFFVREKPDSTKTEGEQ